MKAVLRAVTALGGRADQVQTCLRARPGALRQERGERHQLGGVAEAVGARQLRRGRLAVDEDEAMRRRGRRGGPVRRRSRGRIDARRGGERTADRRLCSRSRRSVYLQLPRRAGSAGQRPRTRAIASARTRATQPVPGSARTLAREGVGERLRSVLGASTRACCVRSCAHVAAIMTVSVMTSGRLGLVARRSPISRAPAPAPWPPDFWIAPSASTCTRSGTM